MSFLPCKRALKTIVLVAILGINSCKSRTDNTSNQSAAANSADKIAWTKEDIRKHVISGLCAGKAGIISGYAAHVYQNGGEFDHFSFDKTASTARINMGLQLLNDAHAEYAASRNLSIWSGLLASLNPAEYMPTPENYDWIKLQKYLYSLFQGENKLAIQRDKSLTAQEQLSRLSLGGDSIWVNIFAKFFQTIDSPRPLTPLEAYLLIAPFNNYDPFLTVGQIGWSTFRDVRLADFKANRDLVQVTKYLEPVFPSRSNPAGQVYHFWGYAGRRIGQGVLMGHMVSDLMSYYWEQVAQNDPEEFFTDSAGKWFAGGLEFALSGEDYTKRRDDGTLVSEAKTFWTKNCAANTPNPVVPVVSGPNTNANFQCVIEPGYTNSQTGVESLLGGFNHNIFFHETAETLREEMTIANRCKGYAWLALSHVWEMPVKDFGQIKQRWERVGFAKWSILDLKKNRAYVEGGRVAAAELR